MPDVPDSNPEPDSQREYSCLSLGLGCKFPCKSRPAKGQRVGAKTLRWRRSRPKPRPRPTELQLMPQLRPRLNKAQAHATTAQVQAEAPAHAAALEAQAEAQAHADPRDPQKPRGYGLLLGSSEAPPAPAAGGRGGGQVPRPQSTRATPAFFLSSCPCSPDQASSRGGFPWLVPGGVPGRFPMASPVGYRSAPKALKIAISSILF